MKRVLKSLALAAFVMAGSAHAAALTLSTGSSVSDQGWTVSNLSGSGNLVFSSSLIGALNAGGVVVESAAPAVVTSKLNAKGTAYTAITAAAPVTSLSGSFDGSTVSIASVGTQGGALLTSEADGFTTTGGSLSITNLKVDLGTKSVYATLVGGNGVGTLNNYLLWNYSTLTGATSFAAVAGTTTSNNTLSGLTITSAAFETFATSLGLTTAGRNAMASITDYGSISSSISVLATKNASTPAVPEPSTYLLMGLGLVGIAAVSKRAKR